MASVTKKLYNGTLTTSSATVYTAPSAAGSCVVVKTITCCNRTAVDGWVTVLIDGTYVLYQQLVPAKKTLVLVDIDHVLDPSDVVAALANAVTTIDLIISGKEVSP